MNKNETMYFSCEDYVKKSEKYRPVLAKMEKEVDHFMAHYHDDSRFISGWGHGYFCEEDGGRLLYDITKPFEHQCSICGKVYHEYQHNSCFVTFMRNEAIVTTVKCAILFRISGKSRYLDIMKSIISYYAEHYHEFVIHAKTVLMCDPTIDVGGAGKIMPQGLNEAIIAIRMVNAMELVRNELEEAWIEEICEKLYTPMFELFYPQKQHIHNIPTWINSAIGVMGFFFGREDWIKEATENPFNLYEQLKYGVTQSGFWYEGSIHYNFFALEGIMNFMVFAQVYGYHVPEWAKDKIINMFDAAYRYAFDNDLFPNPSDGWPNVGLKTYSYVYYMAYKAFGKPILPYLKHIEMNPLERTRLPLTEPYYYENQIPLEKLLFAPDLEELEDFRPQQRKSSNFEAYNCATLRNETFNVFFKYGHQTASHAHPDKMNVEIMVRNKVLTKDLSNSGYNSKMCNEWHRKIASHNTCVVDGKESDMEQPGTCQKYTDEIVKAMCESYPGVTYERSIKLYQDTLQDVFQVTMKKEAVVDWFFHFESSVARENLKLMPVNLFKEYGEGNIQNCMEVFPKEGKLVLENELVTMKIELEPGMQAYLAKTYNNPADKMRDTVIIRKKGLKMCVNNIIKAKHIQ